MSHENQTRIGHDDLRCHSRVHLPPRHGSIKDEMDRDMGAVHRIANVLRNVESSRKGIKGPTGGHICPPTLIISTINTIRLCLPSSHINRNRPISTVLCIHQRGRGMSKRCEVAASDNLTRISADSALTCGSAAGDTVAGPSSHS